MPNGYTLEPGLAMPRGLLTDGYYQNAPAVQSWQDRLKTKLPGLLQGLQGFGAEPQMIASAGPQAQAPAPTVREGTGQKGSDVNSVLQHYANLIGSSPYGQPLSPLMSFVRR